MDNEIQSLRERIVDLQARVENCLEELASIQDRIDDLRSNVVPELVSQRTVVETEVNSLDDKLEAINFELQDIPRQIG